MKLKMEILFPLGLVVLDKGFYEQRLFPFEHDIPKIPVNELKIDYH